MQHLKNRPLSIKNEDFFVHLFLDVQTKKMDLILVYGNFALSLLNQKLDVIYHQYGLFIIAVLAAFLLASVSWWAIVIIEADIQDDIGESLVTVLETTQQAVNSWAKGHRAATQIWADTPEVVQLTEELLATAGTTSDDLLNAPAQARIRDWLRPVYTGKD